ncbi:MAG: hypothetical protein HN341_08305 [Verrucomicrobia bacterium]|nr:hypothetical protein [Verrucomicrobiota bacterium]
MTICRNRCLVVLAIVLLMHSPTLADSVTGRVSRVIDGDTVVLTCESEAGGRKSEVGGNGEEVRGRTPQWRGACGRSEARGVRVRLADIDAPETRQPYGPEAKAALADMIGGKLVVVSYTRKGRYGRILGTITVGECDINLAMVQAGHAWSYRHARKTGAVAEAERAARREGIGLWAADGVVAPWVWRKGENEQGGTIEHSNSRTAELRRGDPASSRFAELCRDKG